MYFNLTLAEFLIGFVVALTCLFIGFIARKMMAEGKVRTAEAQAKKILEDVEKTVENRKKEATLEAKDFLYQAKANFERETKERRQEMQNLEKRLISREENLDRKLDILEKKERDLNGRDKENQQRERALKEKEEKYEALLQEQRRNLERISGMTAEEAKRTLMDGLERETKLEMAGRLKKMEEEAKENADRKAKEITSLAIQRCASDHVIESTVSVVDLPNDEMKGRIIGREGRNIRALEKATGIDLIIDDTPEAVVLSGFDPIRREVAKVSLERLITDGRIHPARIEEIVEKVKKEVDNSVREEGEKAAFELGVVGVHPEAVKLLGRLRWRTSYAQNVLQHSKEVAMLAGVMAAEMGLDTRMAKRAGLLHDIGKAVDHELEGSHAKLGADLAQRYHESPKIVNAIEAHHEEAPPQTIEAVLVAAADALSAARPGARREILETYVKRLEKLEKIADSFEGVEKAFAIQAGREVRIIVRNDKINDSSAFTLAKDIAKKIEQELEYPGQVKVTVIRETRAVEYAR